MSQPIFPTGPQYYTAMCGRCRHSTCRCGKTPGSTASNLRYEPSVLSAESCQDLVDKMTSIGHELTNMRERIDTLLNLRKYLSHRTKKTNEEEYEEALNSPSMVVLYRDYKDACRESHHCRVAAQAYKDTFHNHYTNATVEQHLEICNLQEKWVKSMIRAAKKRLNYLFIYPNAYENKNSILGHIKAAQGSMGSARNALEQILKNKEHSFQKLAKKQPYETN